MRIPRVKEFDPNAKEPVLKSSFDSMPTIEKQPAGKKARPEFYPRKREKKEILRAVKRRHPFDIYVDQYETLKDFAFKDQKRGILVSMSGMVREALDLYIAEKTKK
jgi:hypothetical protein